MTKRTCAPVGKPNNSIVENIYSIIDSKIQYIDYQNRALFRPLIGENAKKEEVSTKNVGYKDLQSEEQWFLTFEKFSKLKKQLLLLRNYLNTENAALVLSLLAEDQLVQFSQKDLEYKLGVFKGKPANLASF